MEYKYRTNDFIEWLEHRKTKIAQKTLKALDRDIALVVETNGDLYLEPIGSFPNTVPNYVYDQFIIYKKEVTNFTDLEG